MQPRAGEGRKTMARTSARFVQARRVPKVVYRFTFWSLLFTLSFGFASEYGQTGLSELPSWLRAALYPIFGVGLSTARAAVIDLLED